MTPEQQKAIARAKAIVNAKEKVKTSSPIGPVNIPGRNQSDSGIPTLGELTVGAVESGTTILSSTGALPFAGFSGVTAGIEAFIRGDEDPMEVAAHRIESLTDALTFQPRTESGKKILQSTVAPVAEFFESGGRAAGDLTLKSTGSPGLATLAQLSTETVPEILFGLKIKPSATRQQINQLEESARDAGVDLAAKDIDKTTQIRESAENISGHRGIRGHSMADVAEAVKNARLAAKAEKDRLYQLAKEGDSFVLSEQLSTLPKVMDDVLKTKGIFPDLFPVVERNIKGFKKALKDPAISLTKIDALRKRLNRASTSDPTAQFALSLMRGTLDAYMDALFNSSMISGSPDSLRKWKEARSFHAEYRKNFSEERVLRDLSEAGDNGITAETMRKWIFGAANIFQPETARTIRKIKNVIGEDSPQFLELRQDAALNLIEPLMNPSPDFRGFISRYDALASKNNSVLVELFPDERSRNALKALRDIASVTDSTTIREKLPSVSRLSAVFLFGHKLAKAAARIRIVEMAFDQMRNIKDAGRRRQIMGEILGYEAGQDVITSGALGIPAAAEATKDSGERAQTISAPAL